MPLSEEVRLINLNSIIDTFYLLSFVSGVRFGGGELHAAGPGSAPRNPAAALAAMEPVSSQLLAFIVSPRRKMFLPSPILIKALESDAAITQN